MSVRGSLALLAGAVLCATFAYADGQKSAQLQAVDANQIQRVSPKSIMKVRMENGRIIPLTPWIELGDFAPAGPCDTSGAGETMVFSTAPVNANTGAFDSSVQTCAAGSLFWFGGTYHNPYYANDIVSLSDPSFNGADVNSLTHYWGWNPDLVVGNADSQTCIIAIIAVEDFDAECTDVHEQSAGEGVILNYGNLAEGVWGSSVCINGTEFALPSTPADDGTAGTELLGGYIVIYGQAIDSSTGQITLATGAQPMLWHDTLNNPQVGTSTGIQFDDDNPADGDHDPNAGECFNYSFDLSGFGCSNPSLLGGAIAFWVENAGCVPSGGDVDGNGCVDDSDLLAVLFAFGGSGGPEDVNCDGVVDDGDLLEVLFNFGSGC